MSLPGQRNSRLDNFATVYSREKGRADIEESKNNVAMNAWLPQASYPCGVKKEETAIKVEKTTMGDKLTQLVAEGFNTGSCFKTGEGFNIYKTEEHSKYRGDYYRHFSQRATAVRS